MGLNPAPACRPGAHSLCVLCPSASHTLSLPQFAHLSAPVTSVTAGQVAVLSEEPLLNGPGFRPELCMDEGHVVLLTRL